MLELLSQSITKVFNKVKWDSNIYFQCAHTMKPQIKKLIQSGDLQINQNEFHTKQELISMIILNQSFMLGQQVHITILWMCKTPLFENLQYTDYFLYHQYIILQLLINENEIKYCCLQKTLKRIIITYSDTFQHLKQYQALRPGQQVERCKASKWQPAQQKKMYLYSNFYELLRFLFNSKEHEKGYDFFFENCQTFCSRIMDFLKKHEYK